MTLAAKASADPHRLNAMEIRGGNDAASDWVSVSGFEAGIYAQPYQNAAIGGDLRFVSTCAMGQIVRFTLIDLAGHGEEAGDTALRLRTMVRNNMNIPNPTNFARAINKEFTNLANRGRFATAVIATYFAPTDHLIVCNAGHPRPLLLRSSVYAAAPSDSREWQFFDEHSPCAMGAESAGNSGIANLPLGIISQTKYPQFATRLLRGDILLSYTDALIEATDAAGKPLGEEGLLEIVKNLDMANLRPDQIGPAVLEAVSAYRAGRPADDDVTLLVLYHTATNPPDGVWSRLKALGRMVGLVK
jgi:sigma-B regulation protein RsbU (phosphoserine phosphatase)